MADCRVLYYRCISGGIAGNVGRIEHTADQLGELLDRAANLAVTAGRDDIAGRLQANRRRSGDGAVEVIVGGGFKAGKSSLVNALLGTDICPTSPDAATAILTFVRYGSRRTATVFRLNAQDERPLGTAIPLDHVDRTVLEGDGLAPESVVVGVDITLPNADLAAGLVLVDTAGVGGIDSIRSAATSASLPLADALVFVADAAGELTDDELAFVTRAVDVCPTVVCALTKVDFYPGWREVARRDELLLGQAGLAVRIFPVSATLRQSAIPSGGVDDESGYPALLGFLRDEVVHPAALRSRWWAIEALSDAVDQLTAAMRAEERSLGRPGSPSAAITAESPRVGLAVVSEQVRQWQQRLSDGLADLAADLEYDLRLRLRGIAQRADEAIDDGDPAEVWEQLGAWVNRAAGLEFAGHFALLSTRIRALVEAISAEFDEARFSPEVPALASPGTGLPSGGIGPKPDAQGLPGQAFAALRSSYGGMWVLGGVGSIALGLATLNPVSLGGGILLGAQAVREDRRRQLAQRRQQAKAAVRSHLDELALGASKASRDAIRVVTRDLRDAFAAMSREMIRTAQEAAQRSDRAVETERTRRTKRGQEVRLLLAQLEDIARQAEALREALLPARAP